MNCARSPGTHCYVGRVCESWDRDFAIFIFASPTFYGVVHERAGMLVSCDNFRWSAAQGGHTIDVKFGFADAFACTVIHNTKIEISGRNFGYIGKVLDTDLSDIIVTPASDAR